MFRGDGAAGGLRAGLLLLVVLGVAGTALALAYERHWHSAWQLAPWVTLGIISVAVVALVVRQTTATVVLARAVAVLAIVSAAVGVWQHIDANLDPHTDHDHDAQATMSGDDHHAADEEDEATADADHHADDEDDEPSAGGHHHGSDEQDEAPARDDHHAADDEDESAAGADHHAADEDEKATEDADHPAVEEMTAGADSTDTEEATAAGPSLGDVMAGSAGHAPVPAALAMAPVGLALGLATIGLGGGRRRSRE